MNLLRTTMIVAAVVPTAATAWAEWYEPPQAGAIRHALVAAFDKPEQRLVVDPVAVVGDHAVAGWTQGDMGGRALLRLKNGAWAIVLCAGDQLLDPNALRHAGLTETSAKQLAAATRDAERQTPPARVAMFSRFEGLVSMEDHSHPQPHPKH
ncbi:copper uptake system-associated protein [Pseudolabrys sp. FHR47]|uniref:copper uptake system-associated protein n=1 Tax=Pseudolabrys sp. FHR47 TaxID=2562284 RepID=UPI0010BE83FE|nr:copper uptake system-associated protein [Pseudolabrys sp. FHR47]